MGKATQTIPTVEGRFSNSPPVPCAERGMGATEFNEKIDVKNEGCVTLGNSNLLNANPDSAPRTLVRSKI